MSDNISTVVISDGVSGCYIPSDRFKTARVSVCAYLPLDKMTSPAYSLLSMLMSAGCEKYPRPIDLNRRLDTLYGASVGTDVDKVGDSFVLRAGIVFADDKFLPEPIFDKCVSLLTDTVFHPAVDDGGFLADNFEREKRMQIENIEGEINDKRTYSRNRCYEIMCGDDPFGAPVSGKVEQTVALTRADVFDAWQTMLKTACFRVTVIAEKPHPEVFDLFKKELGKFARTDIYVPGYTNPFCASDEVKDVTERLPVAQGKLVMGYSVDAGEDSVSFPVMVMVDVLGGGPYSLLFSNVREKMSLCYYCATRGARRKGIVTVDSGVEFENAQKTFEAVQAELDNLKRGDFDQSVIEASKLSLTGMLGGVYDSQTVTDRWYSDRSFDRQPLSPDELSERIRSVTKEDVVRAANSMKLDTVYRLLGQEDEA